MRKEKTGKESTDKGGLEDKNGRPLTIEELGGNKEKGQFFKDAFLSQILSLLKKSNTNSLLGSLTQLLMDIFYVWKGYHGESVLVRTPS